MEKKDSKRVILKNNSNRPVSKEHAKSRYYYSKIKKEMEKVTCSEVLVESKIRQAMNNGSFDDLPGKGQPIDLRSYFVMPEHLRISYHILKNSNYLPEEIRLKKK